MEDSTGFLLWRAHNFWQRELRKRLRKFKLTHTQFVILASTHWLNGRQKEVSQIEIAQLAKTDVMLTSNVLRALEKKQLLLREEHSKDSRAKRINLTQSGIKMLKRATKEVEDFDRQFFSQLTNTTQFNRELAGLLESKPPS